MVCIFCQSETEVTNSRSKARTPSVWRRRTCKQCAAQFTTTELPDYEKALLVVGTGIKKPQPLSRDKLFLSLHKSLGHRLDALNAATALTTTVIGRLLRKKRMPYSPLSVHDIASITFEILKRFDPLAAATYKAYHQAALKSH